MLTWEAHRSKAKPNVSHGKICQKAWHLISCYLNGYLMEALHPLLVVICLIFTWFKGLDRAHSTHNTQTSISRYTNCLQGRVLKGPRSYFSVKHNCAKNQVFGAYIANKWVCLLSEENQRAWKKHSGVHQAFQLPCENTLSIWKKNQ